MLDSAPPLEHTPPCPDAPPNVLLTTYTGRLWYWLSTRIAAPPRSGPVGSQRLRRNRELTTLNRPPRTKMAPPPPPSSSWPVELPSAKVRFCTVSCGVSWSWQCDGGPALAPGRRCSGTGSGAVPPPLSVTSPPPSSTIFGPLVVADLRGRRHRDGHRRRAARERDDAAGRHRRHHRGRGAAGRRAVADHPGRVRGVHRPRLGRHGRVAVRVALVRQRRRASARRCVAGDGDRDAGRRRCQGPRRGTGPGAVPQPRQHEQPAPG